MNRLIEHDEMHLTVVSPNDPSVRLAFVKNDKDTWDRLRCGAPHHPDQADDFCLDETHPIPNTWRAIDPARQEWIFPEELP